jgi:uncharacterized protein (TIGR03382 family)
MLLLGSGTGFAGVITGVASVDLPEFSTGSIGPVGANPAPNNDNTAAASANTVPYSIFFNSPGYAEAEFVVQTSGGTTEYFVTQNLVNNSGQTWTGFLFELGFGTGSSFLRAATGALLDFDLPGADPEPFSSVFTLLDHHVETLAWSGGAAPSIGVAAFRLSVDVPDGLESWNPAEVNRFTLRQTPLTAPAAPEPTGIALAVAALPWLAVLLRRRRGMRVRRRA